MVWTVRLAIILLLVSASAGAQQISSKNEPTENVLPGVRVLPDKPVPRGNFFTRPFYDQQIVVLAEVNTGAALLDDIASRMVVDRGGYERNPFMKPFVHNSGTLAAESVAEVWLMAFVADRMKHSNHPLLRRTWWLPQVINASGKISGGVYNTILLR